MMKFPNRLEHLYPSGAVEKVLEALQQPDISGKVKEALDRVGIRDANPVENVQRAFRQARNWFDSFTSESSVGGRYGAFVNATGQLFSSSNARLPISERVMQAYAGGAVSFQFASHAKQRAESFVRDSLGAPHASWHCSCADAMSSLLNGRNVLIAKSDLVRIPGLGDVASLVHSATIHEVGASNGCTKDDWEQALADVKSFSSGDQPADSTQPVVLLVSPNGLVGEGAMARGEAIDCARSSGALLCELLADGVADPQLTQALGFPSIKDRLSKGMDVVVLPLHILVGAPAGTLVYGTLDEIVSMQREAGKQGSAMAGPELVAALEALELDGADEMAGGITSCFSTSSENLKNRCERLAVQATGNPLVESTEVVEREQPLGPQPWNEYIVKSWAVQLEIDGEAEEFCKALLKPHSKPESDNEGNPEIAPVAVALEEGRVFIDLRFVLPKDDHLIAVALAPDLATPPDDSDSSATNEV